MMEDSKKSTDPSDEFKAKHKDVFGFAEVSIGSSKKEKAASPPPSSSTSSSSNPKEFKGKESLFRVPDKDWIEDKKRRGGDKDGERRHYEPPRNRSVPYRPESGRGGRGGGGGRFVPDFRRNPEKYTKYSLADVNLPTNKSNSQAAFDFLNELKKRKKDEAGGEEEEEERVADGAKIEFKKPTKKKREEEKEEDDQKKSKKKKSKQMTLSHLMDEEEDD